MKDMIYRQAAIEAIDAVFPVDPMKSEYAQGIACGAALAKTYVEQLPYVQPEAIKINIEDFNKEDWERLKKEWGNTPITVLPAQPEIIRCKDCKHKHIENMVWTCQFGLPGGENFFCGYGAEPYKGEQE